VPVAFGAWEKEVPMHGGAHGSGGPKGKRNGNYKHGRYTAEALAVRRWLIDTTREVKALTTAFRDVTRVKPFSDADREALIDII
jgi:hypothetical protein